MRHPQYACQIDQHDAIFGSNQANTAEVLRNENVQTFALGHMVGNFAQTFRTLDTKLTCMKREMNFRFKFREIASESSSLVAGKSLTWCTKFVPLSAVNRTAFRL